MLALTNPGNLTITKYGYDGETTIDASFVVLYKKGSTYYWVSGTNSSSSGSLKTYTKVSESNYSTAAKQYKTSSGSVTIYNLRVGTYYIYETAISTSGYYLEDQSDNGTGPDVSVGTDWRYCGSATIKSGKTTKKSYSNSTGALQITKVDSYDQTIKLEGVYFAIIYYDGDDYYWLKSASGSSGSYTVNKDSYTQVTSDNYSYDSSYATKFVTNSSGQITINYLKKGTYYLYETAITWSGSSEGYYIEDQSSSSTGPLSGIISSNSNWAYRSSVSVSTSNTPNNPSKITIGNKKSGNLEITKTDLDAEEYLGETYYISNTGFKLLYAKDQNGNKVYDDDGNLGIWVTGDIGEMKTYDTSTTTDEATEYFTNSTGKVTVDFLRLGTYYIFESTSNESLGYYLTDQTMSNGLSYIYYKSIGTREYNAVVCAIVVIHSSNYDADNCSTHDSHNPTKVEIQNVRRVKLCGYVWVDQSSNKSKTGDGGYNSLYDVGSEELVQNVTVTVKYKSNNKVKATSYTSEEDQGLYNFGYDAGILIRDLDDYYIEFDYGSNEQLNETIDDITYTGLDYIPVAYNGGYDISANVYTDSSKAMMDNVATYDTDLDGIATTYAGTEEETTYGLSWDSYIFKALYDSDSNTLPYINLGIKKIYDPDYDIVENLMYVKIEINGYSYLYEYGYTEVVSGDPFSVTVPTVSFQDGEDYSYYTRYMYPSDIEEGLTENGTLKVYVVYGITIKNTETYNVSELYMESYLNITSLTNTFDNERYELDTESNTENDTDDDLYLYEQEKKCNKTFAYWNKTDEDNVLEYNLSQDPIEGDPEDGGTGLASNESKTVYIQFKITSTEVRNILTSTTGTTEEDYPTTATANGYHTYTRNDYSWENDIYEEDETHYSKSREESDDAPYLKFILGEDRELSGIVFEDTVRTDTEEVIGDGIYTSGENTVGGVKVELLNASDSSTAQYYAYSSSTGAVSYDIVATTTGSDGITGSDGTFEFTGFIPDNYYLKFTYEDGTSKIYSYDSSSDTYTEIDDGTIYVNDYKSTIVVSEAVIKAINNKYDNTGADGYTDEWYKYYDDDNNTYYSVAVDDLELREKYNDGLVYYYTDSDGDGKIDTVVSESYDSSGNKITSMVAETATFSITIENTEETFSYADSTTGDNTTHEYKYEGFNFGIVKQAKQKVEVEKVITNVSMVNSPTTIFNGNPGTDDLDGVSDLDGIDNEASTYTRIEVEENAMYGADFTVTYEITITNKSNINYYEISDNYHGYYYMFGEKDLNGDDTDGTADYSEEVQISIDSVLDAYDDDLTWLISNTGEDTYEYTITSEYNGATSIRSETTETYIINEESSTWVDANDSTNTVNVDSTTLALMENKANTRSNKGYDYDELLYMKSWGNISREESLSISIVFTKTMSASDDDTSYENVSSVNELSIATNSNKTIASDKDSTKYVRKPQLPDPADSYITISPPTGESESIILYVVIGVIGLIILSAGIVIIKKKVL